jgi:hypothetical protein
MVAPLPGEDRRKLGLGWFLPPVRTPSVGAAWWLHAYSGSRCAGGIGLAWLVHNDQ